MNYLKIYEKFINYCKQTIPQERLEKRNINDLRLNDEYLYTEIHHIIPRSLGGSNNKENLIELLPEEHLFIHQIRWKIFNQREDMLAVRFILNGLKGIKNQEIKKALKSKILTKKILKGYAWMKNQIYNFRKNHKWHTKKGVENISKSMKGKVIVKDAKTGKLIGKINHNHPKFLSGEWVHHSKGTTMVKDLETGEIYRVSIEEYRKYKGIKYEFPNPKIGKKNGNYKELTPEIEEEIFNCMDKTIVENHLILKELIDCFKIKAKEFYKNPKVSRNFFINKYGSIDNLIRKYNQNRNKNIIFEPYFRTKEIRKKISESVKKSNKKLKRRIND